MSERLQVKQPIYPLIGVISAVLIMVVGLLTAKTSFGLYFLVSVWILFLIYGYWRACIAVLPVAAVLSLFLGGLTFLISGSTEAAQAAVSRVLAVCFAVIPGLGLSPILLVRSLSAIHVPRMVTLGMMITLNFFPILGNEIKKVREAMQTRGAGSLFSPRIFYRAFLIPLMMRLVNISDTLSLSVETRGFSTDKEVSYSVYKTVQVYPRDLVFVVLLCAGAGLAVIL